MYFIHTFTPFKAFKIEACDALCTNTFFDSYLMYIFILFV